MLYSDHHDHWIDKYKTLFLFRKPNKKSKPNMFI